MKAFLALTLNILVLIIIFSSFILWTDNVGAGDSEADWNAERIKKQKSYVGKLYAANKASCIDFYEESVPTSKHFKIKQPTYFDILDVEINDPIITLKNWYTVKIASGKIYYIKVFDFEHGFGLLPGACLTELKERPLWIDSETKVLYYQYQIPGPQTSKSYYIKESVNKIDSKYPHILEVRTYTQVSSPEGTTEYRTVTQMDCQKREEIIIKHWSTGFGQNPRWADGKWHPIANYKDSLALAAKICTREFKQRLDKR